VHPLERALYELQQVDSEIAGAERELGRLDPGEREQARVDQIEAEALAAAETLSGLEGEMRKSEARLQGIEEKHASHKARLMSGDVKNPRELEALETEVESLFHSRARLDDRLLTMMGELESLQGQAAEVDARLEKARTTRRVKHETYLRRKQELETRLVELRAARVTAAERIDAPVLKKYQAIADRKGGVAVERIVAGSTEACHTTLPERVVRHLREAEGFQFCDECGRFLVFVDG
jgi:predicted  nucleic acid-binding Zn-ribbon protein